MRSAIALSLLLSTASADSRSDRMRQVNRNLPDVREGLADQAFDAAIEVETDRLPASLLLSIAWGESRFDPTEVTGRVCGIMQVNPVDIGYTHTACDAWRISVRSGFLAGIEELEMMLADRRVHGDLRKALLYRACGFRAFDGTCKKGAWPEWVLKRAQILEGKRIHEHLPAL